MEITAAHYTPIPRRQISPIFHIYVDHNTTSCEENLETHVTDGSGWHAHIAHIWPCDDEYGDNGDMRMYTYSVLWQVLEAFNKNTNPSDIGVEWVSIEVDTHNNDTSKLIELLDHEWRIVEVRITERRTNRKILQFVWRGLDQYNGYHQRLPINV